MTLFEPFTDIVGDVRQKSPCAILFVEAAGRMFAVTFGYGRSLLATGSAASSIAAVLELGTGAKADKEWERIAGVLSHLGRDPNWRTKPSVLDQLRGWKISPGKPRKLKAASLP